LISCIGRCSPIATLKKPRNYSEQGERLLVFFQQTQRFARGCFPEASLDADSTACETGGRDHLAIGRPGDATDAETELVGWTKGRIRVVPRRAIAPSGSGSPRASILP